jgi:hypothetical protein
MTADRGIGRFIDGEAEIERAGQPRTGDDGIHAASSGVSRHGSGSADLI